MSTQPAPDRDDELVDTRTLATLLGIPGSTLRRHVKARSPHLPAPIGMAGGAYVWRRADIDVEAILRNWPKRGRPARSREPEPEAQG